MTKKKFMTQMRAIRKKDLKLMCGRVNGKWVDNFLYLGNIYKMELRCVPGRRVNYSIEDMENDIQNYIKYNSIKRNIISSLHPDKIKQIAEKIIYTLQLILGDFIIKINCNDELKKKIDDLLSQDDEIIDLMNVGSKKKRKKSKKYRKKSKKSKKRKSKKRKSKRKRR